MDAGSLPSPTEIPWQVLGATGALIVSVLGTLVGVVKLFVGASVDTERMRLESNKADAEARTAMAGAIGSVAVALGDIARSIESVAARARPGGF